MIPTLKSEFSNVLDDSYVEPKDPYEDPLAELYLSYYLHYYIILSAPPSLAGSHQVKLGKICTITQRAASHQPFQCTHGRDVQDGLLASPLSPCYTCPSFPGNTSQSIRLTRNRRVCPYSTLVNKSARFFLVGMWATRASPIATASRTAW